MDTNVYPKLGPHIVCSMASEELINLLLEKGKEVRNPEHDWTRYLAGKIKHEYTYDNYTTWFPPLFHQQVVHYIDTLPEGESASVLNNQSISWQINNLWVNYQRPKEYNPPHNHPGDLSFVIYLDIPQEIIDEKHNMDPKGHDAAAPGNIVFEYGERHFGDFLSFCGTNLNVIPEKGLVIIFPAWLTHHVYPFESDVERVSVSGNITLVTEKPLDKTLY